LRLLAIVWRRLLWRTTFIAITGSLGKTTAKECLGAILASRFRTAKTRANENNGVRIYLNVLRVRPWHRFAVLEVAGSAPGMIAPAARVVRPDIAVILTVARTHTTDFPTLDDHAAEKATLLAALPPGGLAVLNGDDPRVAAMADAGQFRVRLFGTSPAAHVRAENVSSRWPARLTLDVQGAHGSVPIETQLVGTHWVTSVLAALATAESCGVGLHEAAAALRGVSPTRARLSPYVVPSGAIVLRDDYNASIDTLHTSLRVLGEASADRRMLVITDFSDSGTNQKRRRRHLASEVARTADVVVFVGDYAVYGRRRTIDAGLPPESVHAFASVQEAATFLRGTLGPGDLVLLKGRTTDHAARIFLAQLGEVTCWRSYCSKKMLCDDCWELRAPPVGFGAAPAVS